MHSKALSLQYLSTKWIKHLKLWSSVGEKMNQKYCSTSLSILDCCGFGKFPNLWRLLPFERLERYPGEFWSAVNSLETYHFVTKASRPRCLAGYRYFALIKPVRPVLKCATPPVVGSLWGGWPYPSHVTFPPHPCLLQCLSLCPEARWLFVMTINTPEYSTRYTDGVIIHFL